ncbi:MAG: RidA family protein [Hyphomicrobiaceae bacterium]
MKNAPTNPSTMHAPLGLYSHAIRVRSGAEWLVIAGQLGVDASGKTADGFRNQAEQCLRNILACLDANEMTSKDLVKLTIYSTVPRCMADVRAARQKIMGESILPTATLVVVAGLASPEFLIEIEAWAAKSAVA